MRTDDLAPGFAIITNTYDVRIRSVRERFNFSLPCLTQSIINSTRELVQSLQCELTQFKIIIFSYMLSYFLNFKLLHHYCKLDVRG